MNNPYASELTAMPAYGRFDERVPGYLADVSLDPDERVLSAVKCNHGQHKIGYLTITTQRIRFFQRLWFKSHDYWSLTTTMVVHGPLPQIIVLEDGSLFQNRGLRPGPFKEFVSLHQVLIESMRWDDAHRLAEPVPVVVTGGDVTLAEELASLDSFHRQGMLSQPEFEAAKRKLLDMGA